MGVDPAPGANPFGSGEEGVQDPTDLGERAESERPPAERPGPAWLGVPGMVGLLVVIAAWSVSHSVVGVLLAVGGLILLFLTIGLAMTVAKREDRPPR
jgi:hypothetical protein